MIKSKIDKRFKDKVKSKCDIVVEGSEFDVLGEFLSLIAYFKELWGMSKFSKIMLMILEDEDDLFGE